MQKILFCITQQHIWCYVHNSYNMLWCYATFCIVENFVASKIFLCYNDKMKIEIVKMKRKTMVLKIIDSENAVLKVPSNFSQKKIDAFLQSKARWLEKTIAKMKERENLSSSFDFMNYVYLEGMPLHPTSEISLDFDCQSDEKKKKLIKKFYLSNFGRLEGLAREIAQKTGLKVKEIKPTTSVRIWGSFNSSKVMKLNWKLLILPEQLCEYVICHELCHGLFMNHKPKFWQAVEKVCPEYKSLKKQLAAYSFVLKADF